MLREERLRRNKQMFKDVENHEHYYHVKENGKYGIGIYPVLFGFRVRIWEPGAQVCIRDLCFGDNVSMVNYGYTVLLDYLEGGGNPRDIPYQSVKPFPKECEFTDWMKDYNQNNYISVKLPHVTHRDLQLYRDQEFSKAGL